MEKFAQFVYSVGQKFPVLFKEVEFNVGNKTLAPNYLQAGMIVFLLFILVLSLANVRKLYLNWSLGGWASWFVMGFLLAIILEGFLIVSGRTVVTGLLGWNRAPKPISNVLDAGREELKDVLGEETERIITPENVIQDYLNLELSGAELVKGEICNE